MKTLVIFSHPNIQKSSSQKFLKASFPTSDSFTYHHLETAYPRGEIDVEREQQLLLAHDRILFQFPFYWYAAPFM